MESQRMYGHDLSISLRAAIVQDLSRSYRALKEEVVTLSENEEVRILNGLTVTLRELHQREKSGMPCHTKPEWGKRQCYMITFKWYGDEQIELENFNVQLALKFDNSKSKWILMETPHEVEVMLTSEENAYGLAGGKWFDGFVNCHSSNVSKGLLYKIIAVNEYRNLDFKCSKDSYYKCLGKRF